MSLISRRTAAAAVLFAFWVLTSCSGPATVRTSSSDFYWSAAKETYAAGNYRKTADHLERLLGDEKYGARVVPWYLLLTSGMAGGYMDLADRYTAGARINKAGALAFRLKAAEYRNQASKLALRFAQNVEQIRAVPLGSMPLEFSLPGGNAAEPALIAKIARGIAPEQADAEAAETMAVQRRVLLTVCEAVGSTNDVAKAEEILSRPHASAPRIEFGKTIAHMLVMESGLYSRDKLDQPDKLAIFKDLAQNVTAEATRPGSARVVQVGSLATAK